jgi:hypothetical protein
MPDVSLIDDTVVLPVETIVSNIPIENTEVLVVVAKLKDGKYHVASTHGFNKARGIVDEGFGGF